MLKKVLNFLVVFLLIITSSSAQVKNPVKWKIDAVDKGNDVYEVVFNAAITGEWHLYDLGPYTDGPNPTVFTFNAQSGYELNGTIQMVTKPKRVFDEMFQMEIGYFLEKAVFSQKIKMTSKDSVSVSGIIEWMVCDNSSCLPPTEYEFSVKLPGAKKQIAPKVNRQETAIMQIEVAPKDTIKVVQPEAQDSNSVVAAISPVSNNIEFGNDSKTTKSIWAVIIEAIIWGFVALLTPCVFPMVPMTVSYFLKSSQSETGNKSKGKIMAAFYGLSIVALYTIPIAIIIGITYFGGGEAFTADIFNWLATHWLPNVLFFIIFMVFAASFFGAFEITLPSWMVNKSDAKSDKGGYVGVFFMALTLVLVSFSCTGPIVGTVLIKSTQGDIWQPIVTMLAFSTAFALPFTIFAFAPSLLKDLPKSGGWLNSVKVVLGFLEVALGFKFLSVADQTYHWGILDREVYLAIWIVVFSLLGLYLLGKLRFAHDDKEDHITVKRLSLSIIVFTFVVYMIPGMWGAPLKALSGYMPPMTSQDFMLNPGSENSISSEGNQKGTLGFKSKYSDFLHLPHGLEGFFEFNEAVAYAKQVKKPLFVDFTGHGCVNCREMEARVWSDPRVLKLLREKFVILALYADDKKEADQKDWVTTETGKVLKSIGKINSHLAMTKYGVNAQPYYAIIDPLTEKHLIEPRGYNLDVEAFIKFLEMSN